MKGHRRDTREMDAVVALVAVGTVLLIICAWQAFTITLTQGHVARPIPKYRLDPNTASMPALCELPGIGEARARRIVSRRVETGPFKSLDQVRNAARIGTSTFEKLRPFLEIRDGK